MGFKGTFLQNTEGFMISITDMMRQIKLIGSFERSSLIGSVTDRQNIRKGMQDETGQNSIC